MQSLLYRGVVLDRSEILRDFDGWSWNVMVSGIDNLYLNLVYQNIRILIRK